jgi:hypothetical protein
VAQPAATEFVRSCLPRAPSISHSMTEYTPATSVQRQRV